jgi:hypothetical protein
MRGDHLRGEMKVIISREMTIFEGTDEGQGLSRVAFLSKVIISI